MPHVVYGCWLWAGHHVLWACFPLVEHRVPEPRGGNSAAWVCWSPWPMAAEVLHREARPPGWLPAPPKGKACSAVTKGRGSLCPPQGSFLAEEPGREPQPLRSLAGSLWGKLFQPGRGSDPFTPGQLCAYTHAHTRTHTHPFGLCVAARGRGCKCFGAPLHVTHPAPVHPRAHPDSQPHLHPGGSRPDVKVYVQVSPHTCLSCALNLHYLPTLPKVTADGLALQENSSAFHQITPNGSAPTGHPCRRASFPGDQPGHKGPTPWLRVPDAREQVPWEVGPEPSLLLGN